MIRCLGYTLIGAIALPLAVAAGIVVALLPGIAMQHFFNVDPLWGVPFSCGIYGAAFGALMCTASSSKGSNSSGNA